MNGETIAGGLTDKTTPSITRTGIEESVDKLQKERKERTAEEIKSVRTGDKSRSFADRLPKGNDEERWIMLNGIPIPSFGLLMSPWRRD